MHSKVEDKLDIRENIARLFSDPARVNQAIGEATREAVLEHKERGNAIASWRDGAVVIVEPQDIVIQDDAV